MVMQIALGVGCKKDTDEKHLISKVLECLRENNIDKRSVLAIGSIDIKKDENGLNIIADKVATYWPEDTETSSFIIILEKTTTEIPLIVDSLSTNVPKNDKSTTKKITREYYLCFLNIWQSSYNFSY